MATRRDDSIPRTRATMSRQERIKRLRLARKRKITEEAEAIKRQLDSQVRGLRDLSNDMEDARRTLLAF